MSKLSNLVTEPIGARYQTLFLSDYFSIHEFVSSVTTRTQYQSKITSQFCVNLPRTGYFTYKAFRQNLEEYRSRVLIEKPNAEFQLTHNAPGQGTCTVIHFSDRGFNAIKSHFLCENISFFKIKDNYCSIFGLPPAGDYLHYYLLNSLKATPGKLHIEQLVFDLIETVFSQMIDATTSSFVNDKINYNHLPVVESAKQFLLDNISSDVNLSTLSRHCCVSPFYLIRLFKQVCGYSPFFYLQQIRLKHAQTLLVTTDLPITDICFRSGFSRLDYFSTTFSKKFSISPSVYKNLKKGSKFQPVSRRS